MAADDLTRGGNSDDVVWEAACFAYENFYDPVTGALHLPTQDEFAEGVVNQLGTGVSAQYNARNKAYAAYNTLLELQAGELETVAANIACF